jgi:Tfp pilus assembly protein PilF
MENSSQRKQRCRKHGGYGRRRGNQEGLATALVRNGKEGEAREVLEEASARHPRHPMLVVSRANLEARAGDYARAHAVLDTGVAGSGAPQVPLALAIARRDTGQAA